MCLQKQHKIEYLKCSFWTRVQWGKVYLIYFTLLKSKAAVILSITVYGFMFVPPIISPPVSGQSCSIRCLVYFCNGATFVVASILRQEEVVNSWRVPAFPQRLCIYCLGKPKSLSPVRHLVGVTRGLHRIAGHVSLGCWIISLWPVLCLLWDCSPHMNSLCW